MKYALAFFFGAITASLWWATAIISPKICFFAVVVTIACIACAVSIASEE